MTTTTTNLDQGRPLAAWTDLADRPHLRTDEPDPISAEFPCRVWCLEADDGPHTLAEKPSERTCESARVRVPTLLAAGNLRPGDAHRDASVVVHVSHHHRANEATVHLDRLDFVWDTAERAYRPRNRWIAMLRPTEARDLAHVLLAAAELADGGPR